MRQCFTVIFLIAMCASSAIAQRWSAPTRGSWVQVRPAQPGDVMLAKGGKGCEIVVPSAENSAVKQAARFLARDIQKISGWLPPIVTKVSGKRAAIHLMTYGDGAAPPAVHSAKLKGLWEAHRVVTSGRDVWLVGSDFRGTAFAAYTLSERLGIDPLYLWTGYTPVRHTTLILKRTDYYAPPPVFRYRGLFHDDEDRLPRPLVNGIPDKNGTVPMVWYKRYFETELRLRFNMVAPYVRVHRTFAVQKLASDWGLFYTSHHYDILLSNPYGYDRFHLAAQRGVTGPYDWVTNKQGLLRFWKGGVLENRSLNCIWPVGLRGTEDYAMPFPAGTTEAQKAQAFGEAIDDQISMTKALLPPGDTPVFHFTLYSEMMNIYQTGLFKIPAGVIIVWSDNNDGIMRGLPAKGDKHPNGVYYHLAYLGGGLSKQTFHTVQPARIAEQFGKIIDANATDFMLVNVSELRDFVMGARMLAQIGWSGDKTLAAPDPAGRYVNWWSREYFGPKAAPLAAKAYRDYYGLIGKCTDLYIGSGKVQGAINSLKLKFANQPFSPAQPETLPDLQKRAAQYQAAMQDINSASAKMNPEEKRFFFENVTLGLLSDYRSTQAAILLVEAMREPDRAKSLALCQQAMQPLNELEKELARGERPPFQGWFGPTFALTPHSTLNPHRPHTELQDFLESAEHELPNSTARTHAAPNATS